MENKMLEKTTPKQKAICYLRMSEKNGSKDEYVQKMEQAIKDKFEIVEWFIDIVDGKNAVNPSLIRLFHKILTNTHDCDVIVTFNQLQFGIKDYSMNVVEKMLNALGIKWIVIEHSMQLWNLSIIDVILDGISSLHKSKLDNLNSSIQELNEEIYYL